MKIRVSAFLLALVLGLATAATAAAGITFEGVVVQGGLIVGRADPGSVVTVDGRPVRVSPEGLFLVGFGRDATDPVAVRVRPPTGAVETTTLTPEPRSFPTQRIDGLSPRQVTPDPEILKRTRAEAALIREVRSRDGAQPFFAGGFAWPVAGRISGVFGSQRILNGKPRAPHSGVDISAPAGTTVAAAADGIVTLVHTDMFYTGKTMMIDHGHGLATVYAHMSAITVTPGQRVRRGAPIGRVGRTGRVTGPHLHWGLSLFDTRLDPALLVGPMPEASTSP